MRTEEDRKVEATQAAFALLLRGYPTIDGLVAIAWEAYSRP